MPDLKHVLDARRAALTPGAGGFDRLIRRRRVKEIRGRITAGVIALAVVAGGFLAASSIWRGTRHVQEGGVPIDRSSVKSLTVAWTAQIAGAATAPVADDGLVFVGSTTEDRLYAFPQACESTCSPVWVADAGSGQVLSTPVLLDGVVLVSSDRLYAFDEHCGGAGTTCRPLWTSARLPRPDGLSAPVVANGRVYVENGRYLYSFDPHCRTDASICPARPVGRGRRSRYHRSRDSGELVAGGDLIYVRWPDQSMSVFSTRCHTRGCPPVWNISAGAGIDAPLTFAGDILYAGRSAYRSDCGVHGDCSPGWVGGMKPTSLAYYGPSMSGTSVVGGTVYMAADRLYAFREDCATNGATCAPSWVGPRQFDPVISTYRSWSTPTVSNDLVFAGTDRLYAFAVGCGAGGVTCEPLWVGPASPGSGTSGVVVAANRVFADSANGTVWAFHATAAG